MQQGCRASKGTSLGNLRALLIGIEKYGEGFAPLPAVPQDLTLIANALGNIGFDIEYCSPEDLANASRLDKKMRDFSESGGPDDVRLIYFSGHGILIDNVDSIVPAFVSRHDASVSSSQRVSTDLSKTVASSKTGLVLFIIDACRDTADAQAAKGSSGWGEHARIARPDEHRFVRLFGCAANQVCQVIHPPGEPAASLFTYALAACLAAGQAVSLQEVLHDVETRCTELLKQWPQLRAQTPRLSYGELSPEKDKILSRRIFARVRASWQQSTWERFDPNKLQCLVIQSERETQNPARWSLKDLVDEALSGETGSEIWSAFHSACHGMKLVSGKRRNLPDAFEPAAIQTACVSVVDAFVSWPSLQKCIRMLIEADLVVFDVTGFEPGMMLLLGIRSAARRWLSVCSHGADWEEGLPLDLPFGLQEQNINSHKPRQSRVGTNEVVERFVRRVATGFQQARKQPNYQDLPGFEALRQLGSHYSAASTISVSERILVLCSYAQTHFDSWQFVQRTLKHALWQRKQYTPSIERIIDYGTPQVIQQYMYEQIRRVAACVVDWSEFKAPVFLELGSRLAVSDWGALQIIDTRHLTGGLASQLIQIGRMRELFDVMPYRYGDPAAFDRFAQLLLDRNPNLDDKVDYNRIHRIVLDVIGNVQPAQLPLVQQLKEQSDALHHPEQSRWGAPQILFSGCREAKQDSEHAACELRIAAWLYMEHRLNVTPASPPELLKTYQDLARSAVNALYDRDDEDAIQFAIHIEDQMRKKGVQ